MMQSYQFQILNGKGKKSRDATESELANVWSLLKNLQLH